MRTHITRVGTEHVTKHATHIRNPKSLTPGPHPTSRNPFISTPYLLCTKSIFPGGGKCVQFPMVAAVTCTFLHMLLVLMKTAENTGHARRHVQYTATPQIMHIISSIKHN